MQRKIGYIFMAFILLVVLLTAFLVWRDYKKNHDISDYEECAGSINGVILTHPDRCVMPSGQSFTR